MPWSSHQKFCTKQKIIYMNIRCRLPVSGILALLLLQTFMSGLLWAQTAGLNRVQIEFFFSSGCDECRIVKEEILPQVLDVFQESVELTRLDLALSANYARLAFYQDKLAPDGNDSVSVVLNGRVFLGGVPTIRKRLYNEVERLVIENAGAAATPPDSLVAGHAAVENRFHSWSAWTLAGVGLADGLNPCAFSTLIFFMTMLMAARQTRHKLLVVGTSFCLAVFATYFALGLGAFHALRALSAYAQIAIWLRRVMAGLLVVLAFMSFKDAWAYRRRGKANEVLLQLPDRIKRSIHGIMRNALSAKRLFFAGLGIGFLVTLLESVCTGQMYLPALTYMAGHSNFKGRAYALLLFYNLMFTLPQVAVFLAAYHCANSQRLLDLSRAHVAPAKLLLGVVFLLLAGLLAWI